MEYALGREELQLLSLVEESRALQSRLDKSKPENNTLYTTIRSGVNLSIQAVQATIGRWAACTKPDSTGLWVEWALDGEGLYRGDRIIEVNGKIISCKTKEDLQKIIGVSGKCQLVVVRKRSTSFQQQQLLQSQEDNQRLQHRISYLEDHVKELQMANETTNSSSTKTGDKINGTHVTSISISSPPTTPPDKPQIYQRGNFVTTIIGGKAVNSSSNGSSPSSMKNHITKTIIKENQQNGCRSDGEGQHLSKTISASKISINSDISYAKRERERQREKEQRREEQRREEQRDHQHHHYYHYNHRNQRSSSRTNANRYSEVGGGNNYHQAHAYARSVEHLNYNMNG